MRHVLLQLPEPLQTCLAIHRYASLSECEIEQLDRLHSAVTHTHTHIHTCTDTHASHRDCMFLYFGNMTTHALLGEDGYLLKILLTAIVRRLLEETAHNRTIITRRMNDMIWKC